MIAEDICLSHLGSMLDRKGADSVPYLRKVQGECCRLINALSIAEDINRAHPHTGPEVTEQTYTDLINFISGVGVSCGEMIQKLEVRP